MTDKRVADVEAWLRRSEADALAVLRFEEPLTAVMTWGVLDGLWRLALPGEGLACNVGTADLASFIVANGLHSRPRRYVHLVEPPRERAPTDVGGGGEGI